MTFIQFKICCCVQNFMKIRWFCTVIWRYNDFQNGGRPPSWNRFTSTNIWDHPRSLCCWPQLPVKFHVNVIHSSEDIVIWIFFAYLAWNAYSGPKMGVLGDFGPINVIIHHWDPQKTHPCINPRLLSYQLQKSVEGSDLYASWQKVWRTHTNRQTDASKFIFCPCIALNRQ